MFDYFSMFLSLLTGLFSTLMMTIFEFPFWRKWGLEGVLEWHENQVLYSKIFRTDRTKINFPGLFFLHFVNGGLGGIGFYFLLTLIPSLITMMFFVGILYGLVLWVLTLLPIHKSITGIDPLRHPLGLGPAITSLTGHILYGVVLSALMVSIF